MKKSQKIIVFSALLLFLITWLYWGNETIGTTHYEVRHPKVSTELAGFKIVQVSDLHNKDFGRTLITAVAEEKPDLIAVTGDLIDANKPDVAEAMVFIEEAVEIAPVYYVTGNHEAWSAEYPQLREQLIQAGVQIMDGLAAAVTYNGETINLLSVADPAFDSYVDKGEQINSGIEQLSYDDASYTILLSHRPELFEVYVDNSMDLVLSGHAHGGQFRLPFFGGVVAPDQGLFPHYTAGTFIKKETEMVVSRGLGNSVIPLRVNNRPEIVVITLQEIE